MRAIAASQQSFSARCATRRPVNRAGGPRSLAVAPRMALCIAMVLCAGGLRAQTAEELVARNLQAKGGIDKIKAIKTLRMTGRLQQGGFNAQVAQDAKAPDLLRVSFTIQGMTQIQAYDGALAWQISPFEGRRDPELIGEDDKRDLVEEADFYGPLVDYREKGNTIEYLGHDTVDGDDAYKLKVTLKNGDLYYYYLDPDTYLEFRVERQQFIRGAVREQYMDLGSYKQVDGVYYPFTIATAERRDMSDVSTVTLAKVEANVPVNDSDFSMPAGPKTASPQQHAEPANPQASKEKPKPPAKGKPPASKPPQP